MLKVKKIHRDIKPHNILINEKGEAKLCDFGISTDIEPNQKRKTVIGTPYYLAPEVIQEAGYDGRVDVWALGISAIEMAEYNPPLHDAHPMRVLFMIPNNPPPTLTNPEHWSSEFNNFIELCLKKDPEERMVPSKLLEHPFIRKKAAVPTLMPYLKIVGQIIDEYGGLDKALREAQTRVDPDDEEEEEIDFDDFDSKAMFGDFSDEERDELDFGEEEETKKNGKKKNPFEDDLIREENVLFTGSDDEEEELNLDEESLDEGEPEEDEEPDSEPLPTPEPEEPDVDLDDLFKLDVRETKAKEGAPPLDHKPETGEVGGSSTEPTIIQKSPMIRTRMPMMRGHVLPLSIRGIPSTTRGAPVTSLVQLTSRGVKSPRFVPKTENQEPVSVHEVFSHNRIDFERLIAETGSNGEENDSLSEGASHKIKADALAEEMRQKLEEEHNYEDFVKYYPDHNSSTFTGTWQGLGLARNPWRNNRQYKLSISQPTILCLAVYADYHGKDSVPMLRTEGAYDGLEGAISVTVLALRDTSRQLVQKPKSIHSFHRWKDNSNNRRAIQIYLEDAETRYVLVPALSLLGDANIEYKLEILCPADVQYQAEELPMMNTQSVDGEWNKDSAGGTIDGIEWRKNPQYLLEVCEPCNLSIFLSQHQINISQMHNIGFYVMRMKNERRKKLLEIDNEQLLVQGQGWRKGQEITSRNPLYLEKGLYVLIPCTFYPRKEAKFTITIASESINNFRITPLETQYNEKLHESKWTEELSGGCTQNPDWINNPRFILTAPTDLSITFFVDRKPWPLALRKRPEFVGIYLFKAKAHQYASLTKEMLESKTKHFSDAKEVSWKVKKLKKGTYIVLVSTFNPNYTGKFLFRACSVRQFSLEPLPKPPMVTIEDEWTTQTCGGAFNFGEWRKNPQFCLKCIHEPTAPPVDVEIILTVDPLPSTSPRPSNLPEGTSPPLSYPYTGFYVFKAPPGNFGKLMKIGKGSVVKITEFQPRRRIVWSTRLTTDHPLVLMPTPFEANYTKFSLSVAGVSENEAKLEKLIQTGYSYSINSIWSIEKGTSGGCHNFSKGPSEQWLDNPKIVVAPKKDTKLTVVVKQDPKIKPPIIAGIYLLAVKREQKLSKRSVITHSEFMQSCEVVLEDYPLQKGEYYMILLTTFNPGDENSFTVDAYSDAELLWKPVPIK